MPSIGSSSLGGGGTRPQTTPLRLGLFDFWPSVDYEVTYGSGLLSSQGNQENSWLNTITPSVSIGAGDHWTVGYSPSLRMYSAKGYRDRLNHTVNLSGRATWENWLFGLYHGTAITSDPLIETAEQTAQTVHSSGVNASLDLGSRGVLSTSLNQSIRFADRHPDVFSWASTTSYTYPWRPKLSVGVGVGFGYDFIDPGVDMFNERLNLTFKGWITRKLSYELGGGVETRSFYGVEASPALSPLANASVRYQVLEQTTLSFGVDHEISTSYYSDQFTRNTSFQATVRQGITERWSVSAGGGVRITSYEAITSRGGVVREDSSTFATASVNCRLTSRINGSLFYSFRGNDSDRGQYSFDSNQFGLRLHWRL